MRAGCTAGLFVPTWRAISSLRPLRAGRRRGLVVHLDRSEIVHGVFGVLAAEVERRHVRMHGREAILQSADKIFIVEFFVAERPKWRRVDVRAASRSADRMAA